MIRSNMKSFLLFILSRLTSGAPAVRTSNHGRRARWLVTLRRAARARARSPRRFPQKWVDTYGPSSGLACRNLKVGLAERGQRQVEGPPLGWIKFGTRFLCRSRLNHTTSSVTQSPSEDPPSSYVENKKRRYREAPTHRSSSFSLSPLAREL